ncbi:hypothetical protein K525DRAFT_255067 [Schizophyllum commune Loenen D]|nr:hypothetical protein K525DRAFT_255067 [Schizophyllum commune Loenen D]
MGVILPQELIDDIVDQLHDDPAALRACCLAGASFLDMARTYLFHAISLSPIRGGAKRCAQLQALLESNPALAGYIRHLRLVEDTGGIARAWLHIEMSLPPLLRRIAKAKALQGLYVYGPASSSISWSILPAPTRGALLDIVASPSLRTLRLERVSGLPYLLLGSLGPSLADLTLLHPTLIDIDEDEPEKTVSDKQKKASSAPARSLVSIQVETPYELRHAGNVEYLLDWLAQRERRDDTSPLRRLNVVLHARGPDTHEAVNRLLTSCAALETVSLYPCSDYVPPRAFSAMDTAIAMTRVSTLRDVTLGGATLRLAPLGVPRWLVRAFELLPASVDSLRIDFVDADWRAGASGFADWESVDETLGAWAARAKELREKIQDEQPSMLLQPLALLGDTQIEVIGRGMRRMALMGAPPRRVTLCLPAELRYTMLGYERLVERIWLSLPRLVVPGVVLDVRSGPGRPTTW